MATNCSHVRSGAAPATATNARAWTASTGSASATRSRLWRARWRMEEARVRPREERARAVVDLARVRRVLVVRHRAAGDLLLTTPALRALRAGLPSAAIDILVSRGTGSILHGSPDVDRVLEIDRRSLLSQASRYAGLCGAGYDL